MTLGHASPPTCDIVIMSICCCDVVVGAEEVEVAVGVVAWAERTSVVVWL